MKKAGIIITIILITLIIGTTVKAMQVPERPAHYHADFGIYENGKLVNYSEAKYMDLKPCTVDQNEPLMHPKEENIHLHNLEGKTIHLHQDGISWHDVLTKLKYDYKKPDTVIYLDKQKVTAEELKKVVENNATLYIHVGKVDNENIDENPSLKAEFDAIGKKSVFYNSSESPIENCGGVDKRTFLQRLKIAIYKW